ncbi:MAG: hypothetical protein K8F25_08690 [Fimbriimonadaceae bacterium]|nr:hypothetical protein [Alphaproteobacteria bacterium]
MRKSLITSLVLHGAILVAALVVLPNPSKFTVEPQESIQVDISNIGDESKRKATSKTAEKPVEKAAPKKTEVLKKVEPAPKVDEKVNTAAREPVAEPPPPAPKNEKPKEAEPPPPDSAALGKLTEEVAEKPKPKEAEVKPKQKPEKKPKKQSTEFNTKEIADLLDKIDGEQTAPAQPSVVAGAPEQGAADVQGTDDAAAAAIGDALVSQVYKCMFTPPAAREMDMSIKVRFQLNQDGSVAGKPVVEKYNPNPIFDATARAAFSAILDCQNYDLPKDRYDLWQENVIDFNPRTNPGT